MSAWRFLLTVSLPVTWAQCTHSCHQACSQPTCGVACCSYTKRIHAWRTAHPGSDSGKCLQNSSVTGLPEMRSLGCLQGGQKAFSVAVGKTRFGCFQMAILARADIVSWAILHSRHWEVVSPAEVTAPHAIPSTGAFLDVGANLGWFSWVFAQSGRKVFSVEAFPQNQRALSITRCLNPDWSNLVTIAPTAVGGHQTVGPCVVRSDPNEGKLNNAGNGVVQCGTDQRCAATDMAKGLNCEETSLKTIDQLLVEWGMPHISMVKVDIEGFECQMLEGAQTLFTKIRPQFIRAELRLPHVDTCWREQAKRHRYHVGRSKGKDRNAILVAQ
eukprot:CAMPEP_0119330880 /NCGR_PEP_ID=MMETSP1333-20130426/79215_1 /TAXON_ID=418940 /ORGANISM="Scyphosphaera apsteinii, Strain RCC1455" /LENGTH=327 /DNA_ID=CAMNT_0007340353 /DNA_START=39 /DNA_END=1022 /DNA_ORIENTATION=-